jgi:hypothetical protein
MRSAITHSIKASRDLAKPFGPKRGLRLLTTGNINDYDMMAWP